jgi:WD40 repeat protein
MSDVFISYSRRDIAFARLIRESLQQSQIDTWIDWDRIPIGERWWQEICEAIQNANVFMFIVSQNSIGSKVCKEEIGLALQNNKRIIPIVVDDLKPEVIQEFAPNLPQYNWVIFERDHIFKLEEKQQAEGEKPEDRWTALPKRPQFEQALEKLSAAIHTDWEWVKYHTRLQVDALRWENNQKNPSYLIRGAELEEAEQQLFRAAGKEPQPTELQVSYVTASRQEETQRQAEQLALEQKSRRREQLVLWAVGIGLLVAVILGVAAWGQRNQYLRETHVRATAEAIALNEANNRATAQANAINEANARATAQVNAEIASTQAVQQRDEAELQAARARSSGLAAQSRNYLDKQVDLSLLLAAEAFNSADTYAARDSLLVALQRQPRLSAFLRTPGDCTDLTYSPDGKLLAGAYCAEVDSKGGCSSNEIQVWDVSTRQPVGDPIEGVRVRFMPDGKNLITRQRDGSIVLVDIQTRTPTALPFTKDIMANVMVVSPDGSMVALAGCNIMSVSTGFCSGSYLQVWDIDTATLLYNTTGTNTYYADSLAFSKDSDKLIFAGCSETGLDTLGNTSCTVGNISEWDVRSGNITTHAIAEDTAALSIAFSPDNTIVAVGNNAGEIIFYDSTTWQETGKLVENSKDINGLLYTPDGNIIASFTLGKTFSVWEPSAGKKIEELGMDIFIHSMTANPNGAQVAESGCYRNNNSGFVCLEGVILLWDVSKERPLGHTYTDINKSYWTNNEFLSENGKWLAKAECIQVEQYNELNDRCEASQVTVVDTSTGVQVGKTLTGFQSNIFAAAMSNDGAHLATTSCSRREGYTACDQSRIDWWDIHTGEGLVQPVILDDWIISITLSPDSKKLFFNNDDHIEQLDLETGLLSEVNLAGEGVDNLAFSPDGRILAASGCTDFFQTCNEAQINFWDTQTWQPLDEPMTMTFDATDVSSFGVAALEFSPQGNVIAIATKSNIRFWDLERQQFQETILPVYGVSQMAFNHAGNILEVYNGDLVLWDMDIVQPIGSTYRTDPTDSFAFAFSFDDAQLIGSSGITWDVDPASWQQRACRITNRNFTPAEWKIFMGDTVYRETCRQFP